jgi:hypothetical protein
MLILDLFYGIFWAVMILIIWFYTDAFIYYAQLFKLFQNIRLEFSTYLISNSDKYFPDFLFKKSKEQSNLFIKFVLKLLSCPLCLNVWLSGIIALFLNNILLLAPIYVLSLITLLGIKKLL